MKAKRETIGEYDIRTYYSREWEEYRVTVRYRGVYDAEKTYFASDKEDMLGTFDAMVKFYKDIVFGRYYSALNVQAHMSDNQIKFKRVAEVR